MRLKHFLGVALSLLLFHPAVSAQSSDLPEGVTKITEVEGITEYLLEENGLRILLFPDPSKPTITVNVTYLEIGRAHV